MLGKATGSSSQGSGESHDAEENDDHINLIMSAVKLTESTEISLPNKNLETFPIGLNASLDIIKLNVQNNLFVTLPTVIFKWEKLEFLNFSFNKISILPTEIDKLKCLKILDVRGNDLEDLPESLGNLHCLIKLNASQNKLTCVPVSLGHLRNLMVVDLSHNLINSLPISLSCLECLTFLDISHNCIEVLETRPRWLSTISVLFLHHNLLEILPAWLNEAPKLSQLLVNHNPLSPHKNGRPGFLETRKSKIGESKKSCLQILNIKNCGIETSPPPRLYSLENLVELHLGNEDPPPCSLMGREPGIQYNILLELPAELPVALGPNLQILDLQHLQLCGLTHDLSPLKALRVLLLCGNPLMWLPDSFTEMSSLEVCDLSLCQLLEVPKNIGNLQSLIKLNLSYNKLGSLPTSMQSLLSLKHLDLYNNHLDVAPKFCMELSNLEALDFGYNFFLPPELLAAEEMIIYLKLRQNLWESIHDKTRTDEKQLPDPDYFESQLPDYESDGNETGPVLNELNETTINEINHTTVNLDPGIVDEPVDSWDVSDEDNDENFDPFFSRGNPWVPPPRWSKSAEDHKNEHYFCPGDNHAPRTKRAVWHYLLPEPGQFDDAE